jgi:WD40 repeat protein
MDAPAVAEGAPAPRQLSYRLARTLTGHEGSVASVKFSPDGQW